jgi:hypothetical protein
LAVRYDRDVRSWTLAGAITLGIAVVTLVFLPFGRVESGNTIVVGSTTCSSPIVSAWHTEPTDSGWFGYAPLTSTPLLAVQPCRSLARHRLLDAAVLAAISLLLARRSRRRLGPAAHNLI